MDDSGSWQRALALLSYRDLCEYDAVIFALRRLCEGGCILADEVGLGKTIEAGLVIAQSLAEGAQRILLG
jgi:SNF2 family DNA or RNA helicase